MKNAIPAKVGTQPWIIVLAPRTKLQLGKKVRFKEAIDGAKWLEGIVDNLEPLRIFLV